MGLDALFVAFDFAPRTLENILGIVCIISLVALLVDASLADERLQLALAALTFNMKSEFFADSLDGVQKSAATQLLET